MKSGVHRTRKAGRRDVVSAVSGAPKVTIEHANDVVFFPVSCAIVRQVLGLLPPGSIDGLRSVSPLRRGCGISTSTLTQAMTPTPSLAGEASRSSRASTPLPSADL